MKTKIFGPVIVFLATHVFQPALMLCMRFMSSDPGVKEKIDSCVTVGHEFVTPNPSFNPYVINAAKDEMDRLFLE